MNRKREHEALVDAVDKLIQAFFNSGKNRYLFERGDKRAVCDYYGMFICEGHLAKGCNDPCHRKNFYTSIAFWRLLTKFEFDHFLPRHDITKAVVYLLEHGIPINMDRLGDLWFGRVNLIFCVRGDCHYIGSRKFNPETVAAYLASGDLLPAPWTCSYLRSVGGGNYSQSSNFWQYKEREVVCWAV